MKNFEEKFTAWVDGRLEGAELAEFERELEGHPDELAKAMAENEEEALKLGNLLRTHMAAPPLRNEDFFNHQLLQQIEAEGRAADRAPRRRGAFWSLSRMAFSGAFLLMFAMVLYFTAVPNTRRQVRKNEQYVSNILNGRSADPTGNILNARSDDPNISATSFHSKEQNVNVVWLDGLSYMPRDHKLK